MIDSVICFKVTVSNNNFIFIIFIDYLFYKVISFYYIIFFLLYENVLKCSKYFEIGDNISFQFLIIIVTVIHLL